jgi:16S rRNA processing protein RimM
MDDVGRADDRGPPDTGVVAGRVGRPHGLDGSFHVTDQRAKLLRLGARVSVGGRATTVERLAGAGGRRIARLAGVTDRAGAEALRGQPLTVARGELPALGEQEWWAHELEGCLVVDRARQLGAVVGLIGLPSCEALEVKLLAGGPPLLVPMVKDAIRAIDVPARRIDVDGDFLGLAESAAPAPVRSRGAADERPRP